MEAMASGLPVVAANAVALPHLVQDGVNGYLFEPGNADDLADKLAVPRQSARHALPIIKRLVGAVERVSRVVPFGERSAVVVGTHYWDRVVEIGLQGATYEFPLPETLRNLAA